MTHPTSKFRTSNQGRNEAGQAGLFAVVNLTVLFAIAGLGVDVGMAYYKRTAAQSAADAAALAAAAYASSNGLTCGTGGVVCGTATPCAYPNVSPPTNNLQVGCLYAQANGFVNNGAQSVSLTANTTAPPGVSGNAPAYWVQANVSQQLNTLFGRFGSIPLFTVSAAATAGITQIAPAACIYVLDPTAAQAYSVTGASTVVATCGVFVNSNSTSAFFQSGSSATTSTQILVNGGAQFTGTAHATPTPTTNAGPQSDPMATLPMPSVSATCNFTNYTLGNSNTATLNPGTYCGGITIQGAARVTFNPGMYIINGGGLNFANSAQATGSGVTFFITGQYGYSPAPVSSTGATVLTLTAPTSGTYQGMLFVQDRNISYSTANTFANSSSTVLTGSLYFPTTRVNYSGASTAGSYTALIAKTISFSGSSNFKNDPTGTRTGLATTVRSLIQ